MRPKVREVIVVEGRYDKNTLLQVVDATVVETQGFGIFKQQDRMAFLRRLAQQRGLILLLDSDGAGFVIRNHLKSAIPPQQLKQAYIPQLSGKEKRKQKAGKEGILGVEGMKPEVLLQSLRQAGATFSEEDQRERPQKKISKADMLDKGLVGEGSQERRRQMLKQLALPAYLSANGLLEVLNLIMDREEFLAL